MPTHGSEAPYANTHRLLVQIKAQRLMAIRESDTDSHQHVKGNKS